MRNNEISSSTKMPLGLVILIAGGIITCTAFILDIKTDIKMVKSLLENRLNLSEYRIQILENSIPGFKGAPTIPAALTPRSPNFNEDLKSE